MEDELNQSQEFFEVEAILDKKKIGSTWKYLIKWVGWSMNDCTWEPLENLNCNELVEEFENKWDVENSKFTKEKSNEKDKYKKPNDDLTYTDSLSDDVSLIKYNKIEKPSFIKKRGRPRKYPLPFKEKEEKSSTQIIPLIHRNPCYGNYPSNQHINRQNKFEDLTENINKDFNNKNTEVFRYLEGNINMDTPMKIKKCKRLGDRLTLQVEWKERDDGIKPEDSYVLNTELRKNFYDLLIDFYESRISFPGEKKFEF